MAGVNVATDTAQRTQQERRESTRRSLLAAAAAAIAESGPSASVSEIARRANVSTGALQYHFETKADLHVAVVEVGWNGLVERSMSVDRLAPPADRVAVLVRSLWEAYGRPETLAAFMISSDPDIDPDVAARIAAVFDAARTRLDELWVETFTDLEVPAGRVASARRFARSHVNGMVIQRRMASVEPEPDEELAQLCHATLSILTAESAP